MLFSLKNDILSFDHPIKYFISQSIHQGQYPIWFNTWALGFPLQSSLTWGVFSTPQILSAALFNFNIYILHAELVFYIVLSGWTMYYLLKTHFTSDKKLTLILACSLMLSGFIVASSQWLLYITVASFLPFVTSRFLSLLKSPSLNNSFYFSVSYYVMFTTAYAAFNIITTYTLVIFTFFHIVSLLRQENKRHIKKTIIHLSSAFIFTILLCLPCLYFSLEVFQNLDRGSTLTGQFKFFNSNYFHPKGLLSLLTGISSAKLHLQNTEGAMQNSYTGLFALLLLPASLLLNWNRNKKTLILLMISLLFLLFAFGPLLPFRDSLNILPGMEYFRHAAIFRFYFIFFFLLYIAKTFSNERFSNILSGHFKQQSLLRRTILFTLVIFVSIIIINFSSLLSLVKIEFFNLVSIKDLISSISFKQTLVIGSMIQFFILSSLLLSLKKGKIKLAFFILIFDLLINTLICTPFFSASSYRLKEIREIFSDKQRIQLSNQNLNEIPSVYIDVKKNPWYNINVYQNKVSGNYSYWGPLILKSYSNQIDNNPNYKVQLSHDILYIKTKDTSNNHRLTLIAQKPDNLLAEISVPQNSQVIFLQNYFNGWKAFYNEKPVPILYSNAEIGMKVNIPKGKGKLELKYEKKWLVFSSMLLHFLVIVFFAFRIFIWVKKKIAAND